MTGKTAISWTEKTWNPFVGCSIVSAGCTNCYAMKWAGRRLDGNPKSPHYAGTTQPSKAGPVWTGKVVQAPDHILEAPLRWQKPAMIFVNSMSDLFHESVPWEWIAHVYGIAIAAVHLRGHILQILTKRAERMREVLHMVDFWELANHGASAEIMRRVDPNGRVCNDGRATLQRYGPDAPPPGIWLGVSAENQATANSRVPALLDTPAAIRWISAEPLLGPLSVSLAVALASMELSERHGAETFPTGGINWVVCGGESGTGARPMNPLWARQLRDECAAAGVPFFFKQWGEWSPEEDDDVRYGEFHPDGEWIESCLCVEGAPGTQLYRIGKKRAGDLLDGQQHHNWPIT